MIQKIISGGQTGADRAALDTAIKFNIDHGGWVPAGRKAEDGVIPSQYLLDEMDTEDYPRRTEQNIRDSQGTVIISRGHLKGGSLLTWDLAHTLGKPCCHVDLNDMDEFEAAVMLQNFVNTRYIQVLNVAGPRASQDAGIYWAVKGILETLFFMEMMAKTPEALSGRDTLLMERRAQALCTTVQEAAQFIGKDLNLRTRCMIANLNRRDIGTVYFALADTIKVKMGLDHGNETLLAHCADMAGVKRITPEDAAMVILKFLKASLEKNHVLRVLR
ncbi:Putative molybdenum carrier [Desulfocicer vacuolatum DSM 3385]|uniref:Putative molybdenum carrier n=1 Tax=Desulfocicer vacuolatum DSM 3385 TaxID=1121400 RepID=A0A1W1ZCE1_9BACT|nr:putative molybdenum carrier protein [Desulfocicer vacuolatum]SMC46089.1 Putative molybdenum carrier [Desulfocicer vacuolatum DSM 3385]